MEEAAEKILEIRRRKGLSQIDFANLLGYSRGYLADVESGRTKPSRKFLQALQKSTGIQMDYLFRDSLLIDLIDSNKSSPPVPSIIYVYAFSEEGLLKSESVVKEVLSGRNTIYVDATGKKITEVYREILGFQNTLQIMTNELENLLLTREIIIVLSRMSKSKIPKSYSHVYEMFKYIEDYSPEFYEHKKRWLNAKAPCDFPKSSILLIDYPSYLEKNLDNFGYYAVPVYLLSTTLTGPI